LIEPDRLGPVGACDRPDGRPGVGSRAARGV